MEEISTRMRSTYTLTHIFFCFVFFCSSSPRLAEELAASKAATSRSAAVEADTQKQRSEGLEEGGKKTTRVEKERPRGCPLAVMALSPGLCAFPQCLGISGSSGS